LGFLLIALVFYGLDRWFDFGKQRALACLTPLSMGKQTIRIGFVFLTPDAVA
jgi:hypothetical protein